MPKKYIQSNILPKKNPPKKLKFNLLISRFSRLKISNWLQTAKQHFRIETKSAVLKMDKTHVMAKYRLLNLLLHLSMQQAKGAQAILNVLT
jgi:hypothetical protein